MDQFRGGADGAAEEFAAAVGADDAEVFQPCRCGKYIFYIDYADQEILNERLQGCFRYMNRMDAGNIFTHSGGFVERIKDVRAKPDLMADRS